MLTLLFEHLLILIMGSNPDPYVIVAVFNGKRPVSQGNSYRPEITDLLEMK